MVGEKTASRRGVGGGRGDLVGATASRGPSLPAGSIASDAAVTKAACWEAGSVLVSDTQGKFAPGDELPDGDARRARIRRGAACGCYREFTK